MKPSFEMTHIMGIVMGVSGFKFPKLECIKICSKSIGLSVRIVIAIPD